MITHRHVMRNTLFTTIAALSKGLSKTVYISSRTRSSGAIFFSQSAKVLKSILQLLEANIEAFTRGIFPERFSDWSRQWPIKER